MSFDNYLKGIADELMELGVPEDVAREKAKSCMGMYSNERNFTPIDKAVQHVVRRIPMIMFSVKGLRKVKKRFGDKDGEIQGFLKTCSCGRKNGAVIYE